MFVGDDNRDASNEPAFAVGPDYMFFLPTAGDVRFAPVNAVDVNHSGTHPTSLDSKGSALRYTVAQVLIDHPGTTTSRWHMGPFPGPLDPSSLPPQPGSLSPPPSPPVTPVRTLGFWIDSRYTVVSTAGTVVLVRDQQSHEPLGPHGPLDPFTFKFNAWSLVATTSNYPICSPALTLIRTSVTPFELSNMPRPGIRYPALPEGYRWGNWPNGVGDFVEARGFLRYADGSVVLASHFDPLLVGKYLTSALGPFTLPQRVVSGHLAHLFQPI